MRLSAEQRCKGNCSCCAEQEQVWKWTISYSSLLPFCGSMAYGKGPRAQEQQREEGEIDGAYILECFPILAVCRAWCSLVVALSYVEP